MTRRFVDEMVSSVARQFMERSRGYLRDEYPAKIRLALERLDSGDLWWRPGGSSNSCGNLVLHLAGNVRQWIVHGLGGAPDVRDRASEFGRRSGPGVDEVLGVLGEAVADADRVLGNLDLAVLGEERTIQGLRVTGLEAVYHVVEHFSMHTGQILWIVKLRTDRDLGLYDVDERGRVVDTRW